MREQLGAAPTRPVDSVTKTYADSISSLAGAAILTTGTTPSMGYINTYNAASGALTVTLPALSGLPSGNRCIVEKWSLDSSPNTVTIKCAGSDTFDNGQTQVVLSDTGELLELQVFTRNGTTFMWKVIRAMGSPVWLGGELSGLTLGGNVLNPGVLTGFSQPWPEVTLAPVITASSSNPIIPTGQPFMTPVDVANVYKYPNANGSGVTIGVMEFAGPPNIPVLQAFCSHLGISTPLNINVISVDGTVPLSNGTDGETMLDIGILAALVPAATINVYYGANSQQAFLEVAQAALSECDMVTCSYGYQIETSVTSSITAQFEESLRAARARNVSFFVSSGDWGSDAIPFQDNNWQPFNEVSPIIGFPANCPSAISVGATRLYLNEDGSRASEAAVSYGLSESSQFVFSGGGRSVQFPDTRCPVVSVFGEYWQGFLFPMSNGNWNVLSSTSGSCQFMGALHAKFIQLYGRFDFMDFALANQNAFFDITLGTNGAYNCKTGRDLVTGIGTPNVPVMQTALSSWVSPLPENSNI